jgi:hypothetical protein
MEIGEADTTRIVGRWLLVGLYGGLMLGNSGCLSLLGPGITVQDVVGTGCSGVTLYSDNSAQKLDFDVRKKEADLCADTLRLMAEGGGVGGVVEVKGYQFVNMGGEGDAVGPGKMVLYQSRGRFYRVRMFVGLSTENAEPTYSVLCYRQASILGGDSSAPPTLAGRRGFASHVSNPSFMSEELLPELLLLPEPIPTDLPGPRLAFTKDGDDAAHIWCEDMCREKICKKWEILGPPEYAKCFGLPDESKKVHWIKRKETIPWEGPQGCKLLLISGYGPVYVNQVYKCAQYRCRFSDYPTTNIFQAVKKLFCPNLYCDAYTCYPMPGLSLSYVVSKHPFVFRPW